MRTLTASYLSRAAPTLHLRTGARFPGLRTLGALSMSRKISSLPKLPLFEALSKHEPTSTAIVHSDSGRSFTYDELLKDVAYGRERLLETAQKKDIQGERIAFLIENSYDYVVTFLSIVANNAIALPLAASFPAQEIRYILNNSEASVLITSEKNHEKAEEVLAAEIDKQPVYSHVQKILEGSKSVESVDLTDIGEDKGGMMLYTSGTTSRPKGVILPTHVLQAQASSLKEAWKYSPKDYLLHVLPLHHIHGCINALVTPLYAGSAIEFLFPFNAKGAWERLAAPFHSSSTGPVKNTINFFTVVPTIYNRLLDSHKDLPSEVQIASKKAISPEHMRLNISGSAALPTPTKAAWTELSSGNVLLERYGMTEVGMALSCGLAFEDRVDGSVGWPLPSVEARLVDTDTNEVIKLGEELDKDGRERQGEVQLRGPTIFKEYYKKPEATAEEFVDDPDGKGKWFKTGDVAIRKTVQGAGKSEQEWAKGPMYFIQGRKSADIIKTGGEKVSALEIEREMLSLDEISECAVVPLEDEKWGQKVAAIVILSEAGKTAGKNGKPWGPMDMRRALKDRLVNYKVPQELKIVEEIPKNAMGKVNKKSLIKEVFG